MNITDETNLSQPTEEEFREYRLQRINQLSTIGDAAYPHKFHVNIDISTFLKNYSHLKREEMMIEEELSIAGRLVRLAPSGNKLYFLDIQQSGLKLQIMANAKYYDGEFQKDMSVLKRGDIVGFTGFPTNTKTGELSLIPKIVKLLSPCFHMIPSNYGLTNVETRYRQRYLDLIVNNNVSQFMIVRLDKYLSQDLKL